MGAGRIKWIAIFLALFTASTASADECVILLHGLARTSASMETMA